jgi:pimeloyl-ACP methyl ester carboxylesterase
MVSRKVIRITFPLLLLVALYFLGPSPTTPVYDVRYPNVPSGAAELEEYIASREKEHTLKPDNEARIIWADSAKRKTEYAVVYLHGFSASQMEGDPVHRTLAKQLHANLYLTRLADHGIDTTEALLTFTAERFWNSAREALAVGNQLGEKVVLLSTSTGGTVALMLAAWFPDKVHALINLSPNIALKDPAAFLLNDPWGLQIARLVMGGKYREWIGDSARMKYWNNKYRLEALVQLEELVESAMEPALFEQVNQPVLTLYYYKNEEEQDTEVSVAAMLKMHKQLGTPDSLKRAVALPNAGAHVLGSPLVSKDVGGVMEEIKKFVKEKIARD